MAELCPPTFSWTQQKLNIFNLNLSMCKWSSEVPGVSGGCRRHVNRVQFRKRWDGKKLHAASAFMQTNRERGVFRRVVESHMRMFVQCEDKCVLWASLKEWGWSQWKQYNCKKQPTSCEKEKQQGEEEEEEEEVCEEETNRKVSLLYADDRLNQTGRQDGCLMC